MHHIKFGCGLLMLANFPTSNRIEVLSPDVFGYFITGGGEGTVDNIIFIKNGSKKLSARSSNLGAQDSGCLLSLYLLR